LTCSALHGPDELSFPKDPVSGAHFSELEGESPLNGSEGVEDVQQLGLILSGIQALHLGKQQMLWNFMEAAGGQILCCFVRVEVSLSFKTSFKEAQKLLLVLREKGIGLLELELEHIGLD
jgi:hypothetical protein